jgi:hypothetical protein
LDKRKAKNKKGREKKYSDMTKRPRDTDHVKGLSDLRDSDKRINVIAVAYSSTPPTNTNGTLIINFYVD